MTQEPRDDKPELAPQHRPDVQEALAREADLPEGGRGGMEQAQPNEGARMGHDRDEGREDAGEQPASAGSGGYGPVDATQPEPGPDPTVGGTDLPGQAQADLTGEEQEVRTENQPPPGGMQVPRESRTQEATLHDTQTDQTEEERGARGA